MKPDKIFMIVIGSIPTFQNTIIEKNHSFAISQGIAFELLKPQENSSLLPAFQSDIIRFEYCKYHNKNLYVDWDIDIKFLPDFNASAGCGVYQNGYKDSFVLWSGIDQGEAFESVIKDKNSYAKNYYRALNRSCDIHSLPSDWYVNYQTGLGR